MLSPRTRSVTKNKPIDAQFMCLFIFGGFLLRDADNPVAACEGK
jgi:hypothetical protein